MARPIREMLLAAVHARLSNAIPTAAVHRSRRSPIDTEAEALPVLVVHLTRMDAQLEAMTPTETHYRCAIEVQGVAEGDTDAEADEAVSQLHADVIAALDGWALQPNTVDELAAGPGEFKMHDADESARPTGEFLVELTCTAIVTTGSALAQE